jgi:outer membrane protein OmpA-like peptidoglycan-associated protein
MSVHASLGSLLLASGCASTTVIAREALAMQRKVDALLDGGGYSCAPREIALAAAHVEFAQIELEQGEPTRAAEHLAEADLQASAAEQLAARAHCTANTTQPPPRDTTAPDLDADGVPDALDACPDEAEDRDGYLDSDGCPDRDNDSDGILDAVDRCPNQAEDLDGDEDTDGCADAASDRDGDGVEDSLDACPDVAGSLASKGCLRGKYRGFDITPEALRLTESVRFEGESAKLSQESYAILDTVAQALRDYPDMKLEVQGHTDSRGDTGANRKLSQLRADAVVDYLRGRGVAAGRLTSIGYGETRPIESNRTSQGRAINRRIELVRTDGGP